MLQLLVTCEHGGNVVPPQYAHLFKQADDILQTHRGLDIGILPVARAIAASCKATFHYAEITRLLVDLNRSLHQPSLWSTFTQGLPHVAKTDILANYYLPYRSAVIADVMRLRSEHPTDGILHLSVHSFTPVLGEEIRRNHIGILFDPKRNEEQLFCKRLKQQIQSTLPELVTEFNVPYVGYNDGFTTGFRKMLADRYLGIELEIRNDLLGTPKEQRQIAEAVCLALARTLGLY